MWFHPYFLRNNGRHGKPTNGANQVARGSTCRTEYRNRTRYSRVVVILEANPVQDLSIIPYAYTNCPIMSEMEFGKIAIRKVSTV